MGTLYSVPIILDAYVMLVPLYNHSNEYGNISKCFYLWLLASFIFETLTLLWQLLILLSNSIREYLLLMYMFLPLLKFMGMLVWFCIADNKNLHISQGTQDAWTIYFIFIPVLFTIYIIYEIHQSVGENNLRRHRLEQLRLINEPIQRHNHLQPEIYRPELVPAPISSSLVPIIPLGRNYNPIITHSPRIIRITTRTYTITPQRGLNSWQHPQIYNVPALPEVLPPPAPAPIRIQQPIQNIVPSRVSDLRESFLTNQRPEIYQRRLPPSARVPIQQQSDNVAPISQSNQVLESNPIPRLSNVQTTNAPAVNNHNTNTNRNVNRYNSVLNRVTENIEAFVREHTIVYHREFVNYYEADGKCSICLEDFTDYCDVFEHVKCGHLFHPECIKEWFKREKFCPKCREPTVITSLSRALNAN